MNSKPIIPPESCLGHLYVAGQHTIRTVILVVVLLHAAVFGALLIQGCYQHQAKTPEFTFQPPIADRVLSLDPGTPAADPLDLSSYRHATRLPDHGVDGAIASRADSDLAVSESAGQFYVIKRGDSLERIAKMHGVTVRAIQQANGLADDRIIAGQPLKLPAPPSKPAGAEFNSVL